MGPGDLMQHVGKGLRASWGMTGTAGKEGLCTLTQDTGLSHLKVSAPAQLGTMPSRGESRLTVNEARMATQESKKRSHPPA